MTADPGALAHRIRALVELQGEALSDDEVAYLGERYARCRGRDPWDVREYAATAGLGVREYRVVRGTGVQDVYRSPVRVCAGAVRTALNDLEREEGHQPAAG